MGATKDLSAAEDLGPDVSALLREAAELTGTGNPRELIAVALKEMIERRRFQNWVLAHEDPSLPRLA